MELDKVLALAFYSLPGGAQQILKKVLGGTLRMWVAYADSPVRRQNVHQGSEKNARSRG